MSQMIEKLHKMVTPQILSMVDGKMGADGEKNKVLEALYAILVIRLADMSVVKQIESLPDNERQDGEKMLGALFYEGTASGAGLLSTLTQTLASRFDVSPEGIRAMLLAGLPLTYQSLKQMAGVQPLADFLSAERADFLAYLPTCLVALLPEVLLDETSSGVADTSAANLNASNQAAVAPVVLPAALESGATDTPIDTPTDTAQPKNTLIAQTTDMTDKKSNHFLKSLLPLVGALIFALLVWTLLRSCQQNPTAMARPHAPTQAQIAATTASPAVLRVSLNPTGDDLYAASGAVGDVLLQQQLQAVIASVFAKDTLKIHVLPHTARDMPILPYLPQVLGFLRGVPDASLMVSDKQVYINATNQSAQTKLIHDLTVALPDDFVVAPEPSLDVALVTDNAITAAHAALEALGDDDGQAQALVTALNLQIINFKTNSTDIPSPNQAVLDKAAVLLGQMPTVRLKIVGHTDNAGTADYNKKLSTERAQAVSDYFVAKGLAKERFLVVGAGFDEPIASNANEQGRFRNRRIEFVLLDD